MAKKAYVKPNIEGITNDNDINLVSMSTGVNPGDSGTPGQQGGWCQGCPCNHSIGRLFICIRTSRRRGNCDGYDPARGSEFDSSPFDNNPFGNNPFG